MTRRAWEIPPDVDRWLDEYHATAVGQWRRARDVRVQYDDKGAVWRVMYLLELVEVVNVGDSGNAGIR